MGRNSGGVNNYAKAGTTGIAVNSNGRKLTPKQVAKMTATATGTSSMQHRDMEKQINRAISRYEAVMGVRERHVRMPTYRVLMALPISGLMAHKAYI